jgi:hypothetical protein
MKALVFWLGSVLRLAAILFVSIMMSIAVVALSAECLARVIKLMYGIGGEHE